MPRFVHLHAHSHYSLLDGLGKIPAMVSRAKELGFEALALTDHGALYGAIEFYKTCRARGIKPIIGAELYVATRTRHDREPQQDDRRYHITLLAKNQEGYRNLIQLVTKAHLEGFYYKPRVDRELMREHASGLIALSGCLSGEIPRAVGARDLQKAERLAAEYREIFGAENFFLELGAHPGIPEQLTVNEALLDLAQKLGIPVVGTNDIHYINKEDAQAQDILVSVQTGARFDDENRLTMRQDDFSMKSPEEMEDFFHDAPEAIENTERIANMCNLEIELGKIQLPEFPVPGDRTVDTYLRELCLAGVERRYGVTVKNVEDVGAVKNEVIDRLNYELSVIEKTGFAPYFLIVEEFVSWAKQNGIVVGPGRGSAAGSLVSYTLNITNIDPLKYNLLFQRFLNPERISMPDIDLDFADHRRDEVIEYVRKKYGHDRVAQIITFGTMAARQAIRDVTRAMGYPYSAGDRIAKMIPFGLTLEEALATSSEFRTAYESEDDTRTIVDTAKKLEGVARHASTHACGVVITKDPLTNHLPLQHTSQSDQTVITQYEMHAVEDLGLLKMDFLGLRNLTIIEKTIKHVAEAYQTEIVLDALSLDDKKTFDLLRAGDTTAVFQLESSGMRRYLKELKPTELEDIIAMISLYRPGPMELIPSYIARKHGKEKITYLHPKLEPILKRTFGIAVYQEQLMEIARSIAGFSYGEADTLRKAVGKKIKKLLDEQREKLISGMIANGIAGDLSAQIWDWYEPFARYGFNRTHGACYALIAYQTAYLKTHHPFEFMAALFNAEGGSIERVAELVQEAKKHDIAVLSPDINTCRSGFTIEYETLAGGIKTPKAIRFGLASIKNVGANIVEEMAAERDREGSFTSLENFLTRLEPGLLNKKSLESMIMAGALDCLGERKLVLTNLEEMLRFARASQKTKNNPQGNLFAALGNDMNSRTLWVQGAALRLQAAPPATKDELLRWEKELLGLYISDHPLNEYRSVLARMTMPIREVGEKLMGQRIKIGGLVNKIKKIITRTGEPMLFLDLEDTTDRIEVIAFPRIVQQNPLAFRENAVLVLEGTVNDRDGEIKLVCDRVEELAKDI